VPPLSTASALVTAALLSSASVSCRPKVTSVECDALLDRYARLVVTETYPDASSDRIEAEALRERNEARGDDAFKNCRSEVSRAEFGCAMQAASADALEKCLE
jgi:hypothetical protein